MILRFVVLIVFSLGTVWSANATVPVPVTTSTTVVGDTVTMPSGQVQSGTLTMVYNTQAVLQAGAIIKSGAGLVLRANTTAPTIASPGNQSFPENTVSPAYPFTVGDAEVPAGLLAVSLYSTDNPALIPATGVGFGGSGTSRTVTITPQPNLSGTANLRLQVYDGQFTTITPPFAVTVVFVNQAPSFTKGSDQTVLEDAGAQTVSGWATSISPGPNESGQTVNFTAPTVSNPGLFAVQPAVSAAGTLTYTPAANANGSSTVTLAIHDNGGTANGGVDTSATQTFTINIQSVNDAPSFTKGPDQTVLEDAGAQSVANWATGISAGPPDESGQTLTFVISSVSNPTLFSVQPSVSSAGTLTYTPAANANGSSTVTLALKDNGGTANGGSDTSPSQTFTINVTAVNDPPSFTKGPDQTIRQDRGAQTVTGWATAISAGPPDEVASQTVAFTCQGYDATLFSAAPQISSAGTLTYTTAPGKTGSTTVNVVLADNGGTANGGSNTAATQSFVITITADQAPTITAIANQNAAPNTVLGPLAFTIADADDPVASLAFSPAPHSSDQTIIPDGNITLGGSGGSRTISLGLLANAQGTTTITVTVTDGVKPTQMTFQVTALDPVWATLPTATTYLVASETVYPSQTTNPSAADALTTTYTYTWYAGTQQVATKVTQLPAVSTATDGPGTATTVSETYDLSGRTIWSQDGEGYISYRAYDPYSSALVRLIADVDTSKTGDFIGAAPWTTPTTATVPVAGGLHLKTDIQVDALGRPVKVTDPALSVSYTTYQDVIRDALNTPIPTEVRTYPGWNASTNTPTGPTSVMRTFWAGSLHDRLAMVANPAVIAGVPTGSEPIALVQQLVRETLDANGRVVTSDTYLHPANLAYSTGTLGTLTTDIHSDYERTATTYDPRGHVIRVVDPSGTIHRTVVDALGRPTSRWQGTQDGGAGTTWTDTSGELSTFVKVESLTYDGGAVGLSLVTTDTVLGDGGALPTPTLAKTYAYDGFGRLVASRGPDQVETFLTLDNLGRPTTTDRYAGVASVGTTPPPAGQLRSRTVSAYDALGQVWQSDAYAVTPGGQSGAGTVGNLLRTNRWYDRRGLLLQSTTGSSARISKARYDGAGRAVYTWTGAATNLAGGWTAARSSAGDILATATGTIFDASGSVVCTTEYQCPDVALGGPRTATGDLNALNSLMNVTAIWRDQAHRPTASVAYGRDNGATRYVWSATGTLVAGANPALPAVVQGAIPTRGSPDYRVTTMTYDVIGVLAVVTDNLNRGTLTGRDGAGRIVKTVGNAITGFPAATYSDSDQTVAYDRLPGGRVQTQHVFLTATSDEQTTYAYASQIDASWVTTTTYPDTQAVTGTYDRQGRQTQQTDQRGVVHQFTYDAAGRLVDDLATTIPAAVDATVKRLERSYDDVGRIQSVSSFAATSGGTALDQVATTYDGWGHPVTSQQEHAGPVGGTTLAVGMQWDDGATGGIARSLRLTGLTYPAGGVTVGYAYPSASDAMGYALDRVTAITSGSSHLAEYDYIGAGALARLRLPLAGAAAMDRRAPVGTASGYDRFWEVGQQVWSASAISDGGQYLHDGIGRITTRVAAWGTGRPDRDDAASYDNLDRVIGFHRGIADATGAIAAASTQYDWSWTLDPAGNWRTYTIDTNGGAGSGGNATQTRLYNLANELQDPSNPSNPSITGTGGFFGSGWAQPAYDAAGFMTTAPSPGTPSVARTLTWDAWGRLVQVAGSDITTWVGRYDARHRLIRWTVGANVRDAYYSEADQELEICNGTAPFKAYTWGLGGGDRLIRYQRDSTGSGTLNESHGVLTDAQCSVTALVSEASGQIEERYRYDAYGGQTIMDVNANPLSGSAYGPRYGYAGRPVDGTTGLANFRARWYQAGLGRFISRDPAGYVDGGSLYQYCRSNPLWWIDPTGLSASAYSWLDRNVLYYAAPLWSQKDADEQAAQIAANRAYLTQNPGQIAAFNASTQNAVNGAAVAPAAVGAALAGLWVGAPALLTAAVEEGGLMLEAAKDAAAAARVWAYSHPATLMAGIDVSANVVLTAMDGPDHSGGGQGGEDGQQINPDEIEFIPGAKAYDTGGGGLDLPDLPDNLRSVGIDQLHPPEGHVIDPERLAGKLPFSMSQYIARPAEVIEIAPGSYQIMNGVHRITAAAMSGLRRIPVIIQRR